MFVRVCVSKGNNLNCHETPKYIIHSSNKRLVDRKNVSLKEHTAPFLEVSVKSAEPEKTVVRCVLRFMSMSFVTPERTSLMVSQ